MRSPLLDTDGLYSRTIGAADSRRLPSNDFRWGTFSLGAAGTFDFEDRLMSRLEALESWLAREDSAAEGAASLIGSSAGSFTGSMAGMAYRRLVRVLTPACCMCGGAEAVRGDPNFGGE